MLGCFSYFSLAAKPYFLLICNKMEMTSRAVFPKVVHKRHTPSSTETQLMEHGNGPTAPSSVTYPLKMGYELSWSAESLLRETCQKYTESIVTLTTHPYRSTVDH